MKTKLSLVFVCFIALTLAFSACNSQNKKSESTEQAVSEKVEYTCPMHPEVIRDKPGKCPKCGMDLVKKESTNNNSKMNMDSSEMKNMKKK